MEGFDQKYPITSSFYILIKCFTINRYIYQLYMVQICIKETPSYRPQLEKVNGFYSVALAVFQLSCYDQIFIQCHANMTHSCSEQKLRRGFHWLLK